MKKKIEFLFKAIITTNPTRLLLLCVLKLAKRRPTYQLLNNLFDQFSERVIWMLTIQMINKFSNDFRIRVRFKSMTFRFQVVFHVFVVGNDAIMNDNK